MMSKLWGSLICISVVFALLGGKMEALSRAAGEGAASAVTLIISIAGMMCLWSGLMEVMRVNGISAGLARLLRPILRRLFGRDTERGGAMEPVSANISANLLGISNAATPFGIDAAKRLHALEPGPRASDALCMLVVVNSASIQLIPATVGALRSAAGAANPFDILPAVWASSAASVIVGIITAKLLSKAWSKK